MRAAWPVIEPTTPLVWGRHLDAICLHLEAVSHRQIRGLVIEVPPRSSKSTIVSVLWPAWEWVDRPETRFLTASYALNLAIRDALRSRRVISSPWYRSLWGQVCHLSGDQNVKSRYENDRTGYRIALSVDSGTTGEGGDITVIDDPHNVVEAESDAVRHSTVRWHDEAFYSRLNDAKTGARVIIGQRVHCEDLIGHVLAQGDWEELRIPEEFEAEHCCRTSLGWQDWRTQDGELLRPERFGPAQVQKAKQVLGSYGYAAQHQQRPVPRSGGMFQRAWFRHIHQTAPRSAVYLRYWDKAGTEGAGDYTAGVLMARDNEGFFWVVDVVRGQWSSHRRNAIMLQTAMLDRQRFGHVQVWTEQEPGASGKESAELTVRSLAGYDAHAEPSSGDKTVRAQPFSAQCEAGNVRLIAGPWLPAYLDELGVFPMGRHDDQVDASSGAFNKLALGAGAWGFGYEDSKKGSAFAGTPADVWRPLPGAAADPDRDPGEADDGSLWDQMRGL